MSVQEPPVPTCPPAPQGVKNDPAGGCPGETDSMQSEGAMQGRFN
mgnify:CR=1 FL=1